ncbi:hypothetical protein DFH09DRAFT_928795, partial [Mycena vulgaris]
IKRYRCIRLRYHSFENWTEAVDILRCNPKWFNNPRYDHVLVNDTPDDLTFVHLVELFRRCMLTAFFPTLVHMLKWSKWVPKTKWDGCRVYEEKKATQFVLLKYLVHGAHVIPVFDANNARLTFLDDLIDGDMFLHAAN